MNPRLLLLEDDPVSAAFLQHALARVPALVLYADTVAGARRLAHADQSLWVFDARLPDGRGGDLLCELRGRGLRVPALALTADDQPEAVAHLRQSGFLQVLTKPISALALQQAVRACLTGVVATWDDAMALTALGGNTAALDKLRALFRAELPGQAEDIAAALTAGDHARAQAQLHRLKASCGFVGAPALLRTVQALSRTPTDPDAALAFQDQARAAGQLTAC